MFRHQSPNPIPLRQLPGVVVLAVALLWTQLLGLVHGVLHSHGGHVRAAVVTSHVEHAHEAHGLLAHLLAPADDVGECRLYDQLCDGGPLLPEFITSSSALPLLPAWVVLQALRPCTCVAFAARAPPASR